MLNRADNQSYLIGVICYTDRVQKLKDARSEAAKEIESYRAQKQKDFEAFEAEVSGRMKLCQGGVDDRGRRYGVGGDTSDVSRQTRYSHRS